MKLYKGILSTCAKTSFFFLRSIYEYEYFIVIQDQYKIIGTTLTIKRIYHSNSMHIYNIID